MNEPSPTALHEAGHATAVHDLGYTIESVSMRARVGHVFCFKSGASAVDTGVIAFAGPYATHYRDIEGFNLGSHENSNDLKAIRNAATEDAGRTLTLSEVLRSEFLRQRVIPKTIDLFGRRWSDIRALAFLLERDRKLSGSHVHEVLKALEPQRTLKATQSKPSNSELWVGGLPEMKAREPGSISVL